MAGSCRACCSSVPYASILAFLVSAAGLALVVIGVTQIADDFILKIANFDLETPLTIIIAVLISLNLVFFIFSFLATGRTRMKLCGKASVIAIGSTFQSLMIILAFLMSIAWLLISCATTIGVLATFLIRGGCGLISSVQNLPCLIIDDLGIKSPVNITFCSAGVIPFCSAADNLPGYTIVALLGALLGQIGAVLYLMAMSANFVHLQHQRKRKPKPQDEQYDINVIPQNDDVILTSKM